LIELSEAAQTYFDDRLQLYRSLEQWAKDDHRANRRMWLFRIGMFVLGVGGIIWLLITAAANSPTTAPPREDNASWDPFTWFIGSGEPLTADQFVAAIALLIILGILVWIALRVLRWIDRQIRPALPTVLSGDQISFMGATLAGQSLRLFKRTNVDFHLRDAGRLSLTALGPEPYEWEYLAFDEDATRRARPSHFEGELVGSAAIRMRQARGAARSLRRQTLVPVSKPSMQALDRIGWLPRDVFYNLHERRALDQVADVLTAFAEAMYQLIARAGARTAENPIPDRTELDAAIDVVVAAAEGLPKASPAQPNPSEPGLPSKVVAFIGQQHLLWTALKWFVVWVVIMLAATSVLDFAWGLDEDTVAQIILIGSATGAVGMTAIRPPREHRDEPPPEGRA
jgi:hypothetical protein